MPIGKRAAPALIDRRHLRASAALEVSGTDKTANRKTGSCRWHFGPRFSDLRDSHRSIFRAIQPVMLLRERTAARPSGFVEPCRPSKAIKPPSGPLWIHEIKHDGFRLLVRREGSRVRLFTRGGYDWADRFQAIVEAASTIRARSFLIDGEAAVCRDDGVSDFDALRSRRAIVK
jgi:ATP dependent DNA ligase domain